MQTIDPKRPLADAQAGGDTSYYAATALEFGKAENRKLLSFG
jgi:hypothetical protein